jgi:hypothetical protein
MIACKGRKPMMAKTTALSCSVGGKVYLGGAEGRRGTMNTGSAIHLRSQVIESGGLGAGSPAGDTAEAGEWDFSLYPNPARDGFNLRFASEATRSIELLDLSGRTVRSWAAITGIEYSLPTAGLAEGAYWVRATEGANRKTRKLLIH